MSRYFLGSLLIGLLLVSSDASFAAGDSCISSEYAVNYSQRQVQLTQNSLIRQQNAAYNLAVNRLNTYQNSASLQVSRMQQRVAQAQMSYDSALNSYKSTEDTYLKCRSAQSAA